MKNYRLLLLLSGLTATQTEAKTASRHQSTWRAGRKNYTYNVSWNCKKTPGCKCACPSKK